MFLHDTFTMPPTTGHGNQASPPYTIGNLHHVRKRPKTRPYRHLCTPESGIATPCTCRRSAGSRSSQGVSVGLGQRDSVLVGFAPPR